MSENMNFEATPPWNKMELQGALHLRPGLAQRVLAEARRQRIAAQDNLRVMVMASFVTSLLLLAYIEIDARTVAPQRLAEWNQVADWMHEFAAN